MRPRSAISTRLTSISLALAVILVGAGCGGGDPEVEVAALRITASQHEIVLAHTGSDETEVLVEEPDRTGVSPGGLTSGA